MNSGYIPQFEASAAMQAGETTTETKSTQDSRKSGNYGKSIGNPKLSEKGQKYYEELKRKYSNMEFILVSEDMKAAAKANSASFANPSKMVVLIDEDKVEMMAEDENYRRQYESIISNASAAMPLLKSSLAGSSANVKGYGMQINDYGTASFFAVIDKSQAAQKERIEKKAAEKKEAAKEDKKKAEKEKQEERLHGKDGRYDEDVDSDTVTITASSIEELIKKINDYVLEDRSNYVQTEAERQVGQNFDFKL